jgi:hypothetical protein
MKPYDFFAAYFHQDWHLDDRQPDDVVARFLATMRADESNELAKLADDLDAFAARFAVDAELEGALYRELGCFYLPSADGVSAREWLKHITTRIRAASSTPH